jgi:hypothetical protein
MGLERGHFHVATCCETFHNIFNGSLELPANPCDMPCDMDRAANGVPDWLAAAEYAVARSGVEWAWEFLRRNHKYRAFWRERIKPYIDLSPGSPSPCRIYKNARGESWPYLQELQDRFGVDVPNPPSCSAPCYFLANSTRYAGFDCGSDLEIYGTKWVNIPLRGTEVAVVIDPARPLQKQIEAISRLGLDKQKSLPEPVRLSRRSPHWETYLRLLDARDAGMKRARIEDVLFAELDNDYPERRRSKTFDNFERAARRIRDEGYRELVAA